MILTIISICIAFLSLILSIINTSNQIKTNKKLDNNFDFDLLRFDNELKIFIIKLKNISSNPMTVISITINSNGLNYRPFLEPVNKTTDELFIQHGSINCYFSPNSVQDIRCFIPDSLDLHQEFTIVVETINCKFTKKFDSIYDISCYQIYDDPSDPSF